MTDEKEAPVGYGRPPRHTQFKPGQSGNPTGRARESRKARHGTEIGKGDANAVMTQQMGLFEVKLRGLVHRALRSDDLAALKEVLRICEKYRVIKPTTDMRSH